MGLTDTAYAGGFAVDAQRGKGANSRDNDSSSMLISDISKVFTVTFHRMRPRHT